MSCAKTAKLIEMPFELQARISPRNHVLDGVQFPQSMRRGNFDGEKVVHL